MPRNGSGVASQPSNTAAVSGDTISSTKFNQIMADVYSIFNTKWPQSLTATLSELGGQPVNANLTSLSTLGTAADKIAYTTSVGAWAETAFPAWARTFNASADIATARTNLGAQASDATLTSLSGLSLVAGDILYATAADTVARLAKGTSGQKLQMNSGETAPEWVSASGVPDVVLEDQKPANTDSQTFTAHTWTTHDLTTEVRDPKGLMTLSANQFTPSVSGWVEWDVSVREQAQSRLYNVTDGAVVGYGSTVHIVSGGTTVKTGGGAAVVAGKIYRIEFNCSLANNVLGASKGTEVYARVLFWQD